MIDTQAIKTKILDLAMRGKLTEQLSEDGTAEELYQRIRDEKDQLIKEGKLKKEKSLPPVNDEEIPFPIPDNWKWVRLLKITKKITDGTHHSPVNNETGDFMYVTAKNIKENGVDLSNITFVSEDIHQEIYSRCNPEKNDVLLIKDGATTGNVTVNNLEEPFSMLSSVALIKPLSKVVAWYVAYAMRSPWFAKYIRGEMTGVGITRVVLKQIETFLIPLPPLAEQQRIVEKIDKVFSVLDTIDTIQEQYANNLIALKAKLIDAAIQGKLTEQLPEDGTAEELYQQIQTEKQTLIKAGKIKKEKPLPEVTADEIPFEIPWNWKWCRIGEIFTLQAGKNIATGSIQGHPDSDNRYPCYGGNGLRGYVNQFNVNGLHALIGRQGALCGNINFASGEFYATEHAVVVYEYSGTNMQWAGLTLRALNLNQYATSVAQPGLAVNKINKVLIPLSPLAEQKRIVQKIDELLPLFEK